MNFCTVLSCVRLFATPWTLAHLAPLSMGILQAKIVQWVAKYSSGDLPNPGIEPKSPTLQADSLPSEPPGKLNNKGKERKKVKSFLAFSDWLFSF